MANTPACPECDQMDRVIRVSSAHSGGIATQTSRSSGVGLTLTRDGLAPSLLGGRSGGVSQSELSRRLTPLSAPVSGATSGLVSDADLIVVLLFIVGGPVLVVLAGMLFDGRSGLLHVAGPLSLAFAFAVLVWRASVRRTRLRAVAAQEAHFRKTVVMPWYRGYIQAWDGLYYCERCDVVFVADSKKAFRPGKMNDLLFEFVGHEPRYGEAKIESESSPGPHRRI
jgi:hypothetical protein